jgi:hypothetical protein
MHQFQFVLVLLQDSDLTKNLTKNYLPLLLRLLLLLRHRQEEAAVRQGRTVLEKVV